MKTDFIVCRYVPRDIHRYSHAAAAAVLLAASLDWDILEKPNKATILRASDGTIIEVPDNTNLKFNVFRSWVNKLVTHSVEFVLTPEVAAQICDAAKLTPDHRRVITDLAEQTLVSTPDQPSDEPEPTIVSREPYMAHLKGQTTYESASSYKRTWSDGHTDFECMICGFVYPTAKGAGPHRQKHYRDGDITGPDYKDQVRDALRGTDPDWVPGTAEQHEANGHSAEPIEPLTEAEWQPFAEAIGIAEAVPEVVPEAPPSVEAPDDADLREALENTSAADLLRQGFAAMQRLVEMVLAENDALKAQIAKQRSDFAGMIALIQELGDS